MVELYSLYTIWEKCQWPVVSLSSFRIEKWIEKNSAEEKNRMVTNWSQTGEMAEGAREFKAETLYSKEIAGAPGRTLLELFPKKT